MVIDELIALLGFKLEGEGALRRFKDGIEGASRKLSEFAAAAARFAAAAGAALGAGLAFLAKSSIQTGAEFEKLRVQLEALEGSSDKAEQALDWIKQFAKDTPLDLQSTVKAYANLRNFGLDPTNGSLMALVDTMAMSGKGAEHLDGLVLALGQAWTKGKLQGEEALQLIERGVPVWDLLSKATGKSTAELIKLSSAGKLGRDVIQQLIDEMGKRAAGSSAKMAKTWEGITGRLEDSWQQFKLAVADAGWFKFVKKQLEDFEAWIEGLWKSGLLDKLAQSFSNTFVAIGESLLRFGKLAFNIGKWIGRQFDNLGGLIADGLRRLTGGKLDLSSLKALGLAVAALVAVFNPWLAVIAAVVLALDDLLAYLDGSKSVIGDLIAKIPEFTKALDEMVPGLGKAVSDGVEALKKGDWSGAGRAALDAFMAVWTGTEIGQKLDKFIEPFKSFFAGISEQLDMADIGAAFDRLGSAAENVWASLNKLVEGVQSLKQALIDLVASSKGGEETLATLDSLGAGLGKLVGGAIIVGVEGLAVALNNVSIVINTVGQALSKIAQGDFMGAWQALEKGVTDVANNIIRLMERMVQAFAPNFSVDEIKAKLNEVYTKILAWVDSINLYDAGVRIINSLFDGMKSLGSAIQEWLSFLIPDWAKGWIFDADEPDAKQPTAEKEAAVKKGPRIAFDEANIRDRMFATDAEQNLQKVTGAQAVEQTVNQVANDNRVTNVEVNAPVTINATTNATAGEIGANAGNAVRAAGRDAGRSLAVTGVPGWGGPR